MDALLEQIEDARNLANIIFDILHVDNKPEIFVQYNYPTAYNVDTNIIVIKAPFSLCNFNSLLGLAHECFHCFDFNKRSKKETYSSSDRKIIDTECDEYAYVYDFEKEATAFACIFAHYFIKEVVEYNITEVIPSISNESKIKFPQLVEHERKMVGLYFQKKSHYITLISQFKDSLIECYEHFIDGH